MSDTDPQGSQLARLLTDLANDPAAPPSTVDAMSVIRAAKAAATADRSADRPAGDDPPADRPTGADPAVHAVAASAADDLPAEVIPFRPSRRRRALTALVAAAAVVAVAALVVPLSLSGGSGTSTSADAERAVAESAAGDAAAGLEQAPAAAPDLALSSAAGAAGAAPTETTAAGSGQAAAAPGDVVATGAVCWPMLSEPVATALYAALPAGAFDVPLALSEECPAVPVGGGLLPGSTGTADSNATSAAADFPAAAAGTALVVRISKAQPGACVSPDPATGNKCAPQLDGTYLATDGPGDPTVFAYGNGNEVAVGGAPDTGDETGLTADQLGTAARAVLGALG